MKEAIANKKSDKGRKGKGGRKGFVFSDQF